MQRSTPRKKTSHWRSNHKIPGAQTRPLYFLGWFSTVDIILQPWVDFYFLIWKKCEAVWFVVWMWHPDSRNHFIILTCALMFHLFYYRKSSTWTNEYIMCCKWATVQFHAPNVITFGAYHTCIYTIILLKSVCLSVGVRKLLVAMLARSSRVMSLTVRIDWRYILSRVSVSVRPRIFLYAKNIQNYREYSLAHATVYFNEAPTGHSWPAEQTKRGGIFVMVGCTPLM